MATRGVPCECFGLFDMTAEPDTFEARTCLHCGQPTPPGRWRCHDCQRVHGAQPDGVLEVLRRERRAASRIAHGD